MVNFIARYLPRHYVERHAAKYRRNDGSKDTEAEYRDLYRQVLRDRGAAELWALLQVLERRIVELRREEEEHAEGLRRRADELKGRSNLDEDIDYTYHRQEWNRVRFDQRDYVYRISIIELLLEESALYAEFADSSTSSEQPKAMPSLGASSRIKWDLNATGRKLFELLKTGPEPFVCADTSYDDEAWKWCGTQEQLQYLIYHLHRKGQIQDTDYWKVAVPAFVDSAGDPFSSSQFRSNASTLGFKEGGAPSTRGEEIDVILDSLQRGSA